MRHRGQRPVAAWYTAWYKQSSLSPYMLRVKKTTTKRGLTGGLALLPGDLPLPLHDVSGHLINHTQRSSSAHSVVSQV
jgi:hypothetical protein